MGSSLRGYGLKGFIVPAEHSKDPACGKVGEEGREEGREEGKDGREASGNDFVLYFPV
jgi:hypothetical protein